MIGEVNGEKKFFVLEVVNVLFEVHFMFVGLLLRVLRVESVSSFGVDGSAWGCFVGRFLEILLMGLF